MKKNLFIGLLLIIFILPYSRVNAATGNLSISCADTVLESGETTECTVIGNSNVDIIDISANIVLSNNLVMESFVLDEMWEGSDFDNGKIDIYTKSGDSIKNSFNVGVITVKVKDNVINSDESVLLSAIEFTYDANEYAIDDTSISIRVPSNINTLSNLTVSGSTFTFSSNSTSYDLTVNSESTTISATKSDINSTITGDSGNKSLNYGLNTFTITVTAENGSKKEYVLNITRPDNRSAENDMLSLEFIGYDIVFDKDKTDYSLELENNISGLGLCTGNATKEDILCINEELFEFSDKTTYEVLFNENNINSIINSYTTECDNDNNCKYYLDGIEVGYYNAINKVGYIYLDVLNIGKNILKVIVTAENETDKIYTFTINRQNEEGKLIDDDIKNPGDISTGDGTVIIVAIIALLALALASYYLIKKNKDLHN